MCPALYIIVDTLLHVQMRRLPDEPRLVGPLFKADAPVCIYFSKTTQTETVIQ